MSREIIINKMYVGKYLHMADNIGHEAINLHRADDGNHYIYLNPSGTIDYRQHENKEITVLLVRRFSKSTYKVLAKAEGIKIFDFCDSHLPEAERKRRQAELPITYNGVSVQQIFGDNFYNGAADHGVNFSTFRADRIIEPACQLLITDDRKLRTDHKGISTDGSNTFYIKTTKGFGRQSLREYYDESKKPQSFCDLNAIIENDQLWRERDEITKITNVTSDLGDPYFNFLKIIRREDDELAFSNMFAYFFRQDHQLCRRFAKEVLGVDLATAPVIEREKFNIDLLISDQHSVIVVENKIKCGINGVDERHNLLGHLVRSQLHDYSKKVRTEKPYCNLRPYRFIFAPDYSHLELDRFYHGKKYRIVYYSKIYQFFRKLEKDNYFQGTPYATEFINAMHRHQESYDRSLEDEMHRRFLQAIQSAKN